MIWELVGGLKDKPWYSQVSLGNSVTHGEGEIRKDSQCSPPSMHCAGRLGREKYSVLVYNFSSFSIKYIAGFLLGYQPTIES